MVEELILIAEPSAPVWNEVAVTTPATKTFSETFTLSNSVCPETSKSALISTLEAKVDNPATLR